MARGSTLDSCTIRLATVDDLPALVGLLEAAALPTAELGRTTVWVAEDADEVCGVAGLQAAGATALLRSVTVDPSRRGHGIGRRLVEHVLSEAARRGFPAVHALAETGAADWLSRQGFVLVDRAEAPAALASLALYDRVCAPDTPLLRVDLGG